MANWFKRWNRRKRDIFEYHDGERTRRIDPLVAWETMFTDPECNLFEDIEDSVKENGGEEASAAAKRLRNMTRRMFHVEEWSEDSPGLTHTETMDLLNRYILYMESLKKKGDRLRTRSERLDSVSPATTTDDSTTRPGSGSSSMQNERTDAEPMCS